MLGRENARIPFKIEPLLDLLDVALLFLFPLLTLKPHFLCGFQILTCGSAGNTPLSLAILSGQHTAVGILLARGAKITMKCYVNAAKDSGMATLLEGNAV